MDRDALPFPLAAGYTTLALNGAKGGATKYLCLQYLNYARWTSQQFSCNLPTSLQIMASLHLKSESGQWTPLGFLKFWRPAVTLLNETVHWGMKATSGQSHMLLRTRTRHEYGVVVRGWNRASSTWDGRRPNPRRRRQVPLCMALYQELRSSFGAHGGLAAATALSTAGEVALTGWSERFGVHMGLKQIGSYRESLRIACEARGNLLLGAWAGAGGLWVRNFSWNFTFFEWKRFLHNAVDRTPENAPQWFQDHLDWLRSLEKKNQANVLTFEAATLGALDVCTYLTFFNMAGDNIKTKMQVDPVRYTSVRATAGEIWTQHGLLGFTRGSLFKGSLDEMGDRSGKRWGVFAWLKE
eukprot:g307.t1